MTQIDRGTGYPDSAYAGDGTYAGVDTVSGYGRTNYSMERRNDLMTSFTDAVRDNPMSAALIGMGALWLFMGGNRMTLLGGNGRRSLFGTVAHGAGDVAQGTAHAASRMSDAVASTVSSTVGGFAETVSDTASRMGEYVGGMRGVDAQSAYRKPGFSNGMEDGSYGSEEERGSFASRMPSMPSMSSLRGSMQDMFERHPMALGVAGLALGAGVAASLPLTAQEQETLGRAGEAVREKVSEVAGQAREMASAAVEEVKNQASSGSQSM